jgi:hypothetical protein
MTAGNARADCCPGAVVETDGPDPGDVDPEAASFDEVAAPP